MCSLCAGLLGKNSHAHGGAFNTVNFALPFSVKSTTHNPPIPLGGKDSKNAFIGLTSTLWLMFISVCVDFKLSGQWLRNPGFPGKI